MKIGDRCFVHGYVDEIRKDTVIIKNSGGYFGTDPGEVITVFDATHPNWIPVSERLPDTIGRYLVTIKNLTGYKKLEQEVFECSYCGDWIFKGWEDNDVIAWMPLPEPYLKL